MVTAASQIVERFEAQVEKHPESLSVTAENREFTYKSLNSYANGIARGILESRGAPNNVALLFDHDADMIAALLGTLKAGKTYVPLDPTYPLERLKYILNDVQAGVLLTNHENIGLARQLADHSTTNILDVDELELDEIEKNLNLKIDPRADAYIMYTSGTTGHPKGVIQNHRNITHFIGQFTNLLKISAVDRIALLTSYSHTVSAIDIFSALLNGAALLPFDVTTQAGSKTMTDWLIQERVTIYHSVPTLFRYGMEVLSDEQVLPNIRLVILGGEPILKTDVELYKKRFPGHTILANLFGSSEMFIATTNLLDKNCEAENSTIPIGYPLDGVEVFLLDKNDRPVGTFGVGELVYKSDFLTPGYWNLQSEFDKHYVKSPIAGDGYVFRSGDIGRILPDGCLAYLGRKDSQVKIRGFRIELTEIEAVLNATDTIKESVVQMFKDNKGENYLVAYCVNKKGLQSEAERLRTTLAQTLPDYMIPVDFLFLDKLPLTPNGKIDRKRLPHPNEFSGEGNYQSPENEIEETLLKIWQEVLEIQRIGVTDNFFRLGGHSLVAMNIINRIYEAFDLELNIGDIFDNQTIRQLAKLIQNAIVKKQRVGEIIADIEKNHV